MIEGVREYAAGDGVRQAPADRRSLTARDPAAGTDVDRERIARLPARSSLLDGPPTAPRLQHMSTPPTPPAGRLVQAYYRSTPVFLFLAWRYGIDIRVPFMDSLPGAGTAYWGVVVACAVLVTVRPSLTAVVGQAESMASASALVLTTWVAYFNAIDAAAVADGTFDNPFTAERVASLALSAGVWIASSLAQRALARTPLRS